MIEAYAMAGILCRSLAFYATRLGELCLGYDAAETREGSRRVGQQRSRARRSGRADVPLEQPQQPVLLVVLQLHERDELAVDESLVRVEQEALTTGHPGAEVPPVRTEDDYRAAGHVLARVVAD